MKKPSDENFFCPVKASKAAVSKKKIRLYLRRYSKVKCEKKMRLKITFQLNTNRIPMKISRGFVSERWIF